MIIESKDKGTEISSWNAVYSSGKIIEKIGPILAINNESSNHQVVKNLIKNCPKKLSIKSKRTLLIQES